MHLANWPMWALVLFLQNISFTYVSRARSSGSLLRHLKASIFSNGIWIFSNMLMLGPLFDYLTGKHGVPMQVMAGVIYTTACVSGSIFAHHLAMKTEKGKNAVGYSAKYAQIPVAEWGAVKGYFENLKDLEAKGMTLAGFTKETLEKIESLPSADELSRTKQLAGTAYDLCVNVLGDSGISAQKFGDEIVTTGLKPSKS